jgi:hypothetical protein
MTGVADRVPVRVVDHLEVVDVGQDDGQGSSVALRPRQLSGQQLHDGAAVPDRGQGVAGGAVLEAFLQRRELMVDGEKVLVEPALHTSKRPASRALAASR